MNKPANDFWHPLNPVERFNLELLTRQYRRNVRILSGECPAGTALSSADADLAASRLAPSGFNRISQGEME